MTYALVQLMRALMAAPREQHWGYQLTKTSGVRSGALYPRLNTMVEEGWLVDGRQPLEESGGRPPRRYFTVTKKGISEMTQLLAKAQKDLRFEQMFREKGS